MKVPGISFVKGRNYSKNTYGAPIISNKYGIAIHNTANDASAEGEADYATRRTDDVSSHFYVDGNSVVQSLDTGWRAWHAASAIGNSNSISVEITGVNGWTRSQWLSRVAWDRLGQVLAAVIKHHWPDGSFQVRRSSVTEMSSNSRVKAFYGHHDMTRAWGGDHTDPGPNFPWDRLFDAVNAALEDDVTKDEIVAAVLEALRKSEPYQSPGFAKEQAERGWAPATSVRSMVEYVWNALFALEKRVDALAAGPVTGLTAEQVSALVRAELDKTRFSGS